MKKCVALLAVALAGAVSAAAAQAGPPPPRTGSYAERMAMRPMLESNPAADSVYALARRELNEEAYDAAIRRFEVVAGRYPLALVAPNAWYWMAYALHRRGIDSDSVADLRRALDALIVHRTLYEDAYTRGDAIQLLGRVRAELQARGDVAERAGVTWQLGTLRRDACSSASIPAVDASIPRLAALSPEEASRAIAGVVFGDGVCADLAAAADVYRRLGSNRDARERVVAALGRSMHASATQQLIAIVRAERDETLRQQAIAWLRLRGDPAVNAFLESVAK